MTTVKKATGALMDAQAAAEAEGIFSPTDEHVRLLRRLKNLRERKAAIETEEAAIEKSILADMEKVGARSLTVNGKNWVLISDTHQNVVYTDLVEQNYPEIVAAYVEAKTEYDRVAAEFTFREKKTAGRKKFDPR